MEKNVESEWMDGRKCLEQTVSMMQVIQTKKRRIINNRALSTRKNSDQTGLFHTGSRRTGTCKGGKKEGRQPNNQTSEREWERERTLQGLLDLESIISHYSAREARPKIRLRNQPASGCWSKRVLCVKRRWFQMFQASKLLPPGNDPQTACR